MTETTATHNYNIVMVGIGGSGKSCLTIRYIADRFVTEYDPTLEDSYRKFVTLQERDCVLDIVDTAGTEDFAVVTDNYISGGEGFLCVYSVTDEKSFQAVPRLYGKITEKKASATPLPLVLCGNKCDLDEDREVSYEKGLELARQLGCACFFETSALTGQNVDTIFHELVKAIDTARENSPNAEHRKRRKSSTTRSNRAESEASSSSTKEKEKKHKHKEGDPTKPRRSKSTGSLHSNGSGNGSRRSSAADLHKSSSRSSRASSLAEGGAPRSRKHSSADKQGKSSRKKRSGSTASTNHSNNSSSSNYSKKSGKNGDEGSSSGGLTGAKKLKSNSSCVII